MNCYKLVSRHARLRVLLALALIALACSPARAQVIFNEIMADNVSTLVLDDPQYSDYFPDYVELFNTTGANIDLGAEHWSLTDLPEFSNSVKYVFPLGTVIPARGYLLVVFDDKTNNLGVLHTGFGLSSSGEELRLYHGGISPVALQTFGIMVPGYSVGRVPDETGEFVLTLPTPVGGSLPFRTNEPAFVDTSLETLSNSLRINEWLAFNLSGGGKTNDDWFELYNSSTNVVSLTGLVFTDDNTSKRYGARAMPPLCFIGPLGYVQVFANDKDKAADEAKFSISSTKGDEIYIWHFQDLQSIPRSGETIIDHVVLPIYTNANVSRGRVPDGGDDIITLPRLSPKESNFGQIPEVVINEVLTHTDEPLEDAIELHNVTETNVNVGNWWISNRSDKPQKFRIPANTIIPPFGYVVFYEKKGVPGGFNPNGLGDAPSFTLNSAHGDEVWLFKGNSSGKLTGYRRGITFGPAENGVSFGRYITTEGKADITAMSDLSFGTSVRRGQNPQLLSIFRTGAGEENPAPKVGPVVINEIHYHPPDVVIPGVSTNDNTGDEFIELRNITDGNVPLYFVPLPGDNITVTTNHWKLDGDLKFEFPPNQFIPRNGYVLLLNFDPDTNSVKTAAWTNHFKVPGTTKLYGPYKGKLSNKSSAVELYMPDHPQAIGRVDEGFVPYILVDKVRYYDSTPWPTNGVDKGGASLQRVSSFDYGNDPINWFGNDPTAGRVNNDSGIERPIITRQPVSRTVRSGLSATFSVVAHGDALHFQWYMGDKNGSNFIALAGKTSATLTLNPVNTNSAGKYFLAVTNVGGALTSSVVNLTVTIPPPDTKAPFVSIAAPSANYRTTNSSILVTGTAQDDRGVEEVQYSLHVGEQFLPAFGTNKWTALVDFEPGTNWVFVRSRDTSANISATNRRSFFYTTLSRVNIATNHPGDGTVTGATNRQPLEVGRGYLLTATPKAGFVFSNWTGAVSSNGPKLSFMMVSNLSIVANFVPNPFLKVKGAYNGLIWVRGCATNESTGFFTFTLTDRGTYTASVLLGGKKYPAAGTLDLEGFGTNRLSLTKTSSVQVVWSVELHGSNTISGTVSNGVWTAALLGDRAPNYVAPSNSPWLGKYTWVLPGQAGSTNIPAGDSFGTISIDRKGVATLAGTLAEGTKISQSVPVSTNGHVPFYVSLYSGKGSLVGWLTNSPAEDFTGDVCWIRPALTSLKIYTNGFNYLTNFIGSRYVATNPILNVVTGQVVLSDGRLDSSWITGATLGANSKMTNTGPGKLVFNFTLASGLFTGSYQPTNTVKALPFSGAVLQRLGRASGFFINSNQSGRVSFKAAP